MKRFLSHSEEETKQIAQKIAKRTKGRILALSGQLGAGKTTFASGFAQGLGIKDKIISPTFIFIRQHPIPNTNKTFYHIDLYRIQTKEEIGSLGLGEILNNPKSIALVEWAEKAAGLLSKNTIRVKLNIVSENEREVILSNPQLLS